MDAFIDGGEVMLARDGMLICPNGRPLMGSLAVYFYAIPEALIRARDISWPT